MNKKEVKQLQNIVLNNARKNKTPLTIYLTNGVQVKGIIKSFDEYCIFIDGKDNKEYFLYKHAISTIIPENNNELL